MQDVPTLRPDKQAPQIGELKALVEMYYDAQKFRIRGSNRISALVRGASEASADRLKLAVVTLKDMESSLAKTLADAVQSEPVAPWLLAQRGIGPVLAAGFIASGLKHFDEHGIAIDKPSSWWRFAGVGVVNGRNQRLRRGEKRTYNGFLRRTLFLALGAFLKAHQPEKGRPAFYAEWYYHFKEESKISRPDIQPSNCRDCEGSGEVDSFPCSNCHGKGMVGVDIQHHKRAALLVQRVFLTHLQMKWREAIGLPPPRMLYIVEKEPGIHEAIMPPE